MMSYCATEGIIQSLAAPDALETEPGIRVISLFDHEEIGSQTAQVRSLAQPPSVLPLPQPQNTLPLTTASLGVYFFFLCPSYPITCETYASSFLHKAPMHANLDFPTNPHLLLMC